MDMRYDMRMDGRRMPPRNARGEFTRRGRGRRMDRGMYDMGYPEMRGDMNYGDMARGGSRGRRDMGMYPEMDGHHYPMHGGRAGGYEPVEFMGYCTGYAGAKEDYGYPMYDMRGRGGDMGYRNYDMRGRDYGYGYDYGDYGETLSEKELDHWCEKLKKNLDEQEKQMFNKDIISQKAKQMGMQMKDFGESLSEKELHEWCEKMKKHLSDQEKQMLSEQVIIQKAKQMGMSMDGFTEKELYVNTVRNYTDHKKSIGQNPDLALRMAYEDFHDEDGEYNGKGSQWLAVYYDNFVKVDD